MRIRIALLALLPPLASAAQIEVDHTIILDGAASEERQVTGLEPSQAPGDALTAGTEQEGALRYAEPSAGSVWNVTLPGLDEPMAGTHITLKVPTGVAGAVMIQLNGGAESPVEWEPGTPVDAGELQEGFILSLVYNGDAWQAMNGRVHQLRQCPGTMVPVNGQFCIDPFQRSATDFATAVNNCATASRRMCTWGEFIAACQHRTELGLQNPSSDWEWTNNSANEANNVRMVKLSNCELAGTRHMASPPAPYRCCFTR